jgi:hypothetical protein
LASNRHLKVEPGSFDWNRKVGRRFVVVLGGAKTIDVFGGVES